MTSENFGKPLYLIPEVWKTCVIVDNYTVEAMWEFYTTQTVNVSLF